MKLLKKLIPLFLFPLFLNCLTSNQTKNLSRFSHNAIHTSEITENELVNMRNSVILMNSLRLSLPGIEPEDPSYDNLDETLSVPTIYLRVQTVNALKAYGSLISLVVNDNSDKELAIAAQRFLDSTDDLKPENRKFTDAQKNEYIQNIIILNSLWVEYKKKEALKRIILSTKNQINELCDLLITEFDYKKYQKIGLQHQITTNRLLISSQESMDNSKKISEKTKGLKAFRYASLQKIRREEIYPKIVDSLILLKKSNEELVTSFEKDDYSPKNLKEFSQLVERTKEISVILK